MAQLQKRPTGCDQVLHALHGISRALSDGAHSAHPRYSAQESGHTVGPTPDGGRNAGGVGRTRTNWLDGLRDRAMLHLCFAGGLRVSELVACGLLTSRFNRTPASSSTQGSSRTLPAALENHRHRAASVVGDSGTGADPELFLNARGQAMTRSGFEYVLDNTSRPPRRHAAPSRRNVYRHTY